MFLIFLAVALHYALIAILRVFNAGSFTSAALQGIYWLIVFLLFKSNTANRVHRFLIRSFPLQGLTLLLVPLCNIVMYTHSAFSMSETILAITAVCAEELLFRGALIPLLRNDFRCSDTTSALLTAAVFALAHLIEPGGIDIMFLASRVIPAFGCGMLLALVFIQCKSMIPCIVLHALINLTAGIAPRFEIGGAASLIISVVLSILFAMIACARLRDHP